jgi:hypothetical protein
VGGVGTLEVVKRWYYIVLIGLGILGTVYVYLHRQELGLAFPRSAGGGDAASSGVIGSFSHSTRAAWQSVDRLSDGFTVEMPAEIKEIQIPAYNQSGGSDQVNMIFSNPDAETTYSVAWADDPPVARTNGAAPEWVLDMARDEALARTQTTLLTETRTTSGGFPARDIVARNSGGGVMDSRLILAGKRLYMLTAAFPSMSALRQQDVTRFFNSFKVVQ